MKLTREVTRHECPWLPEPILPAGTDVYLFTQATYGVVGPAGQAVTLDPGGDYPFFEIPWDALPRERGVKP